jgi:hypothetical protein
LSTLKEIRKKLKNKGAKKEDVKMALEILIRLELLDSMVFPENPATVNFSIKKHHYGFPVGYHPYKNDEIKYTIYLDGIAELFMEEKGKKCLWIAGNRKGHRLIRPIWEELIVPIVAHEVRHRVQQDCSLKKFSPKSSILVEDDLLRSIIEFNKLLFNERRKIYIRENKPKAFIRDRINRKEFDATIIEGLVANTIHQKNAYSLRKEIVSIIKMQAP